MKWGYALIAPIIAGIVCAVPAWADSAQKNVPAALQRLEAAHPPQKGPSSNNEFKGMRPKAIRKAAYTYAVQNAVHWRYARINKNLKAVSSQLDRVFDFKALMLDKGQVIPPVVTVAHDGWRKLSKNASKSVIREFHILKRARIASTPPTWRQYLIHSYPVGDKPNSTLYPKNAKERGLWDSAVKHGWKAGVKLAMHLYRGNLARLKRDYLGMVLFHRLADQGVVSVPVTAQNTPRIKVNGRTLSVGEREFRITLGSHFNHSSRWKTGGALDR